jgi:hypothetical protein
MQESDEKRDCRVEQEELYQKALGKKFLFTGNQTNACKKNQGDKSDGEKIKENQNENQKKTFFPLLALYFIKIPAIIYAHGIAAGFKAFLYFVVPIV